MQGRNVYALLLFVLCSSFTVWPQTAAQLRDLSSVRPMDRILLPIANDRRAVLSGQRPPLATPGYSIGKAAPDLYMQRMVLVMAADPAQDAALEELLRAQHDSESLYYHQWLTPAQFGARFGISQNDLGQVRSGCKPTAWRLRRFRSRIARSYSAARPLKWNRP